jgi:hypothetical protein
MSLKTFPGDDMPGQINAFDMAQKQFDSVAKLLKLDDEVAELYAGRCRFFTIRTFGLGR